MTSEPITILHISDIHLSQDKLSNQKRLIGPLLDDIRSLNATPSAPQLIVITGDLVDDGDSSESYGLFFDEVIAPLLDVSGLSGDRLIVAPGNHDARRSVIERFVPFGTLSSDLRDRERLNAFYEKQKNADYFFDKFKNFGTLRSTIGNLNATSENSVYSTYYLKDFDLSIIVLNSAWLSAGGLNGNEKGMLAIPEAALYDAQKSLPKAARTLLLSHHPLAWMTDENSADLSSIVADNTFHLFGHVHDPVPESKLSLSGRIFGCQSGALYTARRRYSGYSVLSLAPDNNFAQLTYRSYFEKRQRYAPGSDLTEDGNYYFSEESKSYWQGRPKKISSATVTTWVKSSVAKELLDKLSDEFTRKPVKDIFVEPSVLRDEPTEDDADYKPLSSKRAIRWADFVRSNANHIIRGRREFGKSTILKELAFELGATDDFQARPRVPIIVQFKDISLGGNSFVRLLRGNTAECPEGGFTFKQLSDDGYLCVMIDDVNFDDISRVREITNFMKEHPRNRYVLTTLTEYSETLGSVKSAEFPVPLEPLRLEQFSRGAIRRVVENLHPASKLEQEQLLNRILRDLRSMNVPCTAVNGAILLTVFQSEKSFVPVNRAIVLERFIEITLDRYALSEAQRSTFDSTNKSHLLAAIAKWMCERDRYVVDYSDIYEFAQKWLAEKALKYSADKILEELLSARILSRWANDVGFTYRSFLEYFVAKAMQYDRSFKQWVMSEDRYLRYIFELEYYSGLDRNDAEMLDELGRRFVQLDAAAIKLMGFVPDIDKLESLKPPPIDDGFDVSDIMERQLNLPRLSQEERDEILEADLPVDISHRQEVYRPAYESVVAQWQSALILYSRVFRNMEFATAADKARHLAIILKSWATYLLVFLQLIPNLAKNRAFFINGIKYEVLAPKEMKENVLGRFLFLSAPRAITTLVFENVGSEKIAGTLEDENKFAGEPAISKFLRRSLYADLRLPEFIRVIGQTYEDLRQFSYLAEAFIWKINYSYRRLFLDENEDQAFRRVLAKMLALRTGERGKRLGETEANALQRLEKSRLIEVLRRQAKD